MEVISMVIQQQKMLQLNYCKPCIIQKNKTAPLKYLSFLVIFVSTISFGQIIYPAGGGEAPFISKDQMSAEQLDFIQQQIDANIDLLIDQGKIVDTKENKSAVVNYEFPLAWNDGFNDYNFFAISNFIDQDPTYPGSLLDYSCGTRSYDTDDGYNHSGIDYFLWPFDWNLMEDGAVKIVAAAPGTIVYKSDGNFDHNCSFNNLNWNAIYIRHADNSVAWYGHMKNGSTTEKEVGEYVETGEYLGLVGSSGNSTGPHLHFETHDAEGFLIDPYNGVCNLLNLETWWADQEPYFNPMINKIQTHAAPPVFNPCPEIAALNEENNFEPGDPAYFVFYARDLRDIDQCHLKITMPDGAVWYEWDFYQPVYYIASYWYWWYTLPADAQEGIWKWSCEVAGNYYEHEFVVGQVPADLSALSSITSMTAYFSDDQLTINLTSNKVFDAHMQITSYSGQIVLEMPLAVVNGTNQFRSNIENLSAGIYFITMSDEETGLWETVRLMID